MSSVTTSRAPRSDRRAGAALTLLVAAGYYALSRVGLSFDDEGSGVTALWPASGFALGVFVLTPRQQWRWLALAILSGNLVAEAQARGLGPVSPLLAAVNALEPWLAALVLQWVGQRRRISLSTVRELCGLIVAAVAAVGLSALLGASTLALFNGAPLGRAWVQWWLADGVGVMVLTPLVVSLVRPRAGICSRYEEVCMLAATAVTSGAMFSAAGVSFPNVSRFTFFMTPLVMWAAIRAGSLVMSAVLVIVGALGAWGTVHGWGPFALALSDRHQAILSFQAFMCTAVALTLGGAVMIAERRNAEARLRGREVELARLNERLLEDARRDPLTGLRNRRALSDDVQELEGAEGTERVALALCDVDCFKAYNDQLGHMAGDHALKAIAGIVSAALRAGDVAYRFGGEELLLVLRDAGPREALAAAERVRAAVASAELPHPGGLLGRFTVSIGVAAGPDSYGALLAGADAALYEAKRAGRNRVIAAPGGDALRSGRRRSSTAGEPVPRHLRSMLRMSREAVAARSVDALAAVLAETIRSELSFRVVAVNLLDTAHGTLRVAAVLGDPDACATLSGAAYAWSEWEPMFRPENERAGAIWLPGESSDWTPSGPVWSAASAPVDQADAWQPDDALLLPLRGAEGQIVGVVSVDQPLDGRRPDDAELAILMAVADHAGLVIEQVQLSTVRRAQIHEQSRELRLAAVMLLAETLDLRHPSTAEHSRTVGRYARATAQQLGLPPDRVERVHAAGVVHDLGKLGISDAILSKPTALDDAEWAEIRRHPDTGARILENAGLDDIAAWVRAHHERVDGCGYPDGIGGEAIPLEARILAVADSFEAMTATRPYRRGLDPELACAELRRCAGTQFDAVVVEAFLAATAQAGIEDRALDRAA